MHAAFVTCNTKSLELANSKSIWRLETDLVSKVNWMRCYTFLLSRRDSQGGDAQDPCTVYRYRWPFHCTPASLVRSGGTSGWLMKLKSQPLLIDDHNTLSCLVWTKCACEKAVSTMIAVLRRTRRDALGKCSGPLIYRRNYWNLCYLSAVAKWGQHLDQVDTVLVHHVKVLW